MPRWIVVLQDGTEWSDDEVAPYEVPLHPPLLLIVQPCVLLPDGSEMAQASLVNYTHHVYRTDLMAGDGIRGLWLGHDDDASLVRAFQHYGQHISAVRSSTTSITKTVERGTPGFKDAWMKARRLLGRT